MTRSRATRGAYPGTRSRQAAAGRDNPSLAAAWEAVTSGSRDADDLPVQSPPSWGVPGTAWAPRLVDTGHGKVLAAATEALGGLPGDLRPTHQQAAWIARHVRHFVAPAVAAALSHEDLRSITSLLRAVPPRVLQEARLLPAVQAVLDGAWSDRMRQKMATAFSQAQVLLQHLRPSEAYELAITPAGLAAALDAHPVTKAADSDRKQAALKAMRRLVAAPARAALARGDPPAAATALSAAARQLASVDLGHISGAWLAELHAVQGAEAAVDMPDQSALRAAARTVTVEDLRRAAGAAAVAQTRGTLKHAAVGHASLAQFTHWLRGHTELSLPGVAAGLGRVTDAASPDYPGGLRAAEAEALLPFVDGRRAATALHTGVVDTKHLPGDRFMQWSSPSGLRLHVTLLPSGTAVLDVLDAEAGHSLHIVYTHAAQDKSTRDRLKYELFAFLDCRYPPTVEVLPASSVALSRAAAGGADGDVPPALLGALARMIGAITRSACDPAVQEDHDPVVFARRAALQRHGAANQVRVPAHVLQAIADRHLDVPHWAQSSIIPDQLLLQPVTAPDGYAMDLKDAIRQYDALGTVGGTRDAVDVDALRINYTLADAIQEWVDTAATTVASRASHVSHASHVSRSAGAAVGGPASSATLPREP